MMVHNQLQYLFMMVKKEKLVQQVKMDKLLQLQLNLEKMVKALLSLSQHQEKIQ